MVYMKTECPLPEHSVLVLVLVLFLKLNLKENEVFYNIAYITGHTIFCAFRK